MLPTSPSPSEVALELVRCRGRAKNLSVNFSCCYRSKKSSWSVFICSQPISFLQNPVSDWWSRDMSFIRDKSLNSLKSQFHVPHHKTTTVKEKIGPEGQTYPKGQPEDSPNTPSQCHSSDGQHSCYTTAPNSNPYPKPNSRGSADLARLRERKNKWTGRTWRSIPDSPQKKD